MSIYIAHRRKNASDALNVPSTDQKETSSVYTTKTVHLHVRLTQIVLEQVPHRWSSDSEGTTAVRIELKPWNNINLSGPIFTARRVCIARTMP